MTVLFGLIWLLSGLATLLGLIRPSLVGVSTRRRALIWYGVPCIVSFGVAAATLPPNQKPPDVSPTTAASAKSTDSGPSTDPNGWRSVYGDAQGGVDWTAVYTEIVEIDRRFEAAAATRRQVRYRSTDLASVSATPGLSDFAKARDLADALIERLDKIPGASDLRYDSPARVCSAAASMMRMYRGTEWVDLNSQRTRDDDLLKAQSKVFRDWLHQCEGATLGKMEDPPARAKAN